MLFYIYDRLVAQLPTPAPGHDRLVRLGHGRPSDLNSADGHLTRLKVRVGVSREADARSGLMSIMPGFRLKCSASALHAVQRRHCRFVARKNILQVDQ